MSNGYTKQEFLDFMDYLGDKGLVNKNTVSARKAAVNAFMGILGDDELEDVRKVDIDSLATRFANLQGSNFTPSSLQTYKSRYKSAFDDFIQYRENPLGFRPSISTRKRPSESKSINAKPADKRTKSSGSPSVGRTSYAPSSTEPFILQIPIRNGLVRIAGLPEDLSKQEAQKIANVVLALATDD